MKLVIASGFAARLVGWLGRRRPPADEALWLTPCRAVHTLGMRFAIDLAFLDRQGRVLRIAHDVQPGRLCWHWRARSVLEMPAGNARRVGLSEGTVLRRGPAGRLVLNPAVVRGLMVLSVSILALAAVATWPVPARSAAPLLEDPDAPIAFEAEWRADPSHWTFDAGPSASDEAAHQTRRSTAPALPPRANRAERAGVMTQADLPPLVLLRPLAPETLDRLASEAESLFLARQWRQALEAYQDLVGWDPGRRHAWLRVGNLHHQREQIPEAIAAYQRAAAPAGEGATLLAPQDASARNKALANLVTLNLEQVRASMAQWEQSSRDHAAVPEEWPRDARQAIDRLRSSLPAVNPPVGRDARGGSDLRPTGAAPLAEPGGTASEWSVSPRARPSVEYLRDPPLPDRARPPGAR